MHVRTRMVGNWGKGRSRGVRGRGQGSTQTGASAHTFGTSPKGTAGSGTPEATPRPRSVGAASGRRLGMPAGSWHGAHAGG